MTEQPQRSPNFGSEVHSLSQDAQFPAKDLYAVDLSLQQREQSQASPVFPPPETPFPPQKFLGHPLHLHHEFQENALQPTSRHLPSLQMGSVTSSGVDSTAGSGVSLSWVGAYVAGITDVVVSTVLRNADSFDDDFRAFKVGVENTEGIFTLFSGEAGGDDGGVSPPDNVLGVDVLDNGEWLREKADIVLDQDRDRISRPSSLLVDAPDDALLMMLLRGVAEVNQLLLLLLSPLKINETRRRDL
ncbi:hypothetical protein PsorP6_013409 [Peronosclerospora sorghi]|uniref:Uncharacterized protein n=1 Tax=Peronosclerospora sorghi TaxID=230839 RepID=A0ACC0VJ84_9STRA|nr:hypothetical protein PsorP6_013409 [Peronosclerospora sorghi]